MMSYTRKRVIRAHVVTARTRYMFVIIKTKTAQEPYKVFHISFKVFHKKLPPRIISRLARGFTPYAWDIINCEEDLDYVISEVIKQPGMYKYVIDNLGSGIIQSYTVKI